MKLYALLIIGLFTACMRAKNVVNASKTTPLYTVSGKVQQQFPYCGGARPTREMLIKATNPVAFPNKTFYLRNGNTNTENGTIAKSFTTNKEGLFCVKLSPGTYSIILEEQLKAIHPEDYRSENQKVNEQCLIEWWKKPYYLLEVKDQNIISLNFTFIHRCFLTTDIPCITYTGPLPH